MRASAFPARDAAEALPREAACTTVVADNWQLPGSAGDIRFVLIMLKEGLRQGWHTDCLAGFLVLLDCPEMQLLSC